MLFHLPKIVIAFFVGQPEEVEALVDTLTIEGATLTDTLSNCELQQLAELSQELHLSNEIESQSKFVLLVHLFCVFLILLMGYKHCLATKFYVFVINIAFV